MLDAQRILNRVCKWRLIFAGWQLGTRSKADPEAAAVRDHREVSILLRVESSAMASLLIKKGVFTAEEFTTECASEAILLDKAFERRFPGIRATDDGMELSMPQAAETMRDWRP
jgi:hypothetical protein